MDDFNDYLDDHEPEGHESDEAYGPLFPSDFEDLDAWANLDVNDTGDAAEGDVGLQGQGEPNGSLPEEEWTFLDDSGPVEAHPQLPLVAENYSDTDQAWQAPPILDIDTPEPSDGFPWTDVDALGSHESVAFIPGGDFDSPSPADLGGHDTWEAAQADRDPSISALARWWSN
ncbi:hypothetical protein [Natronoglycomyces albus]|uniref:Uncharacterized protein n=1 Tax=Natronoglycomyces albus TaxID=2811108 RepID=A0A895XTG7_9ACTN|nr:hypothetical protein [Natronoglycomyces albus]QSB06783.1 hypothetical protein JQS30_07810 [Natronoglycomyces albus]